MKIAFLIMAHHQPAHLFRLVNALDHPEVKFFIHIDLKFDIGNFKRFPFPQNVYFIEDRVIANHCGYSCVEAMINLMKTAYSFDDFKYYSFLTGSDYPIKSNEYIHEFLSKNYPMNFISYYISTDIAPTPEFINQFYFIDFIAACPHVFLWPLRAVRRLLSFILPKRKFIEGCKPYQGSAHFSLNRETVGFVLDFLKTDKYSEFDRYFKYCFSPDEMFFHNIILNSKYAEQCFYYERDIRSGRTDMVDQNKAYLHYVDWDRKREIPAILVEDDFEKLKESKFLFARKFSETKSKRILDLIDTNLR